jgi:ATP-dependent helicase Lhr and Lhr-like helicase
VPVPDHVLVRQTVDDCLTEPLDAEGLVALLGDMESGRVAVHFTESAEPSPLAHGILTGRPFTFLDGAPLEERRTRAVAVPRGLGVLGPDGLPPGLPVAPGELAAFDPVAEAEVVDQVRPGPRDADELHDLLLSLVLCRAVPAWHHWFDELASDGRAGLVGGHWAATERRAEAELVHASLSDPMAEADEALAECVGGHLDLAGPVTVERLVDEGELPAGGVRGVPVTAARARSGLARRQALGSAIDLPDGRWCARHLLVRIHAASRSRRRRRVEAVPVASYLRFLACWQHLAPGTHAEGRAGLLSVVEQLQGIEAPAGEWERHLLPARVVGYDPRWLDELCLAGQVAWGRLTPRPDAAAEGDEPIHRGTSTPSPATPLALLCREDLGWMLAAVRAGREAVAPSVGASADLLAVLRTRGASFRSELPGATGRLDSDVDEGLWDLVSRGIVTADAFAAVRSLLAARARRGTGRAGARRSALGRTRALPGSGIGEGRWSLLPDPEVPGSGHGPDAEELAEAVAWQLLARWGVVAWDLWERESYRIPWRDVVRALRRLEARGQVLGGRFVAGISGEQYAAVDAADLLGQVHRDPERAADVTVAGADPLNLTGGLLVGPRVPSVRNRSVRYRDGVPVDTTAAAS